MSSSTPPIPSASTTTTATTYAATPPTTSITNEPPPKSTTSFEFPREYNFPPFFTRQTNLATLHSQRETWSSFILDYCRYHRIFRLSLSASGVGGTTTSTTTATSTAPIATTTTTATGGDTTDLTPHNTEDLFHNRRLDRRLSLTDARDVLDHMRKAGRAEPVNSSSSSSASNSEGGDVYWIYWRTPEEWASQIESYVDETAQRGTVLTLYELVEGEGTRGRDFYGLHPDLLQKALQTLVKRGKAQIFGQEDSQGVKFF